MSATSGLLYTGIIWTFEDCQFINNTANTNNGGAVDLYLRDNTGTDGDGDFVEPAFSFRNCLFDSNTALGNDGGALQIRTRGDVVDALTIIENCTFTNNKTADTVDDGGALNLDYSHSGDSRKDMITDCLFSNNSSGNAGGAVSVSGGGGGEITIERCEFTSNTAVSNNGGACLFAPGGTSSVILKNCLFAKNYVTAAGTDGGAIAFDGVFYVSFSCYRPIFQCIFISISFIICNKGIHGFRFQ